jgi:hypothetical protein
MRLMPNRSAPCLELEMQEQVANHFSERKFQLSPGKTERYGKWIYPRVYREISIPHIGRVSDIVIYITDNKIINIECKMTNYDEVINQAISHLSWADYSYVCFYADTYLPSREIKRCLDRGIGLLLWKPEIFVEVIQSTWNKKADKEIRKYVLEILKKKKPILWETKN